MDKNNNFSYEYIAISFSNDLEQKLFSEIYQDEYIKIVKFYAEVLLSYHIN